MTYRVAINGFGRIGRDYLRCVLERGLDDLGVRVVAVNDLWEPATLAHLFAYDSTFGRPAWTVDHDETSLWVDGRGIATFREPDPDALPWGQLNVDLVIEATGNLRARDDAGRHLKAGASRVLITAPSEDTDTTLVVGINDDAYDPIGHRILSAASCTTNCVAPMLKVLHDTFGLRRGYLTTVHAYTSDQPLLDGPHNDLRRARTAAVNIVPTSMTAARAVGIVLPELAGRLDGLALRVPVKNGSVVDLTCELAAPATAEQVNLAMRTAADEQLRGLLRYAEAPIVSQDIVGDPASCVFDADLTRSTGAMVKVCGWYDNEWGHTNRLVDLTAMLAEHALRLRPWALSTFQIGHPAVPACPAQTG